MMQRDEVVETLRRELRLPVLAFNSDNVCRLIFDKRLTADFECPPDQDGLHLYAVVGQDLQFDAARYRELLAANLFGRETGAAVLAVDDQRDEVLLFRTLSLNALSATELTAEFLRFVTAAGKWQERLSGASAAVETLPDAAGLRV